MSYFITEYILSGSPQAQTYSSPLAFGSLLSEMFIALFLAALAFNWQSLAEHDQQPVLPSQFEYNAWNITQANSKRIAIIGSGVAGAVSTYYFVVLLGCCNL
jgi:hypothetical protein